MRYNIIVGLLCLQRIIVHKVRAKTDQAFYHTKELSQNGSNRLKGNVLEVDRTKRPRLDMYTLRQRHRTRATDLREFGC